MRTAYVLLASILSLVAALVPASLAEAQRLGGQRYSPAGSEDGIFETEGADRRAIMFPYVALHAHYALNPVITVDGDGNRTSSVVEHLVGADLVASLAVWEGLEFGVLVPVTLFSSPHVAGSLSAPGTEMGDLSVRVAYRIRVAEHTAIALHVPVLFPTNTDNNVLALGWGARPTIAFMQRMGPLELLVNASALIRESANALDFRGGSEFGARLGARVDLSGVWATSILAEIGFSTAFDDFFGAPTTPAEIRAGMEHWFDNHWRLSGFVGTGIGPGVGAPDFRAGVALAFGDNVPYRPRPSAGAGDADGDGILDEDDECPDEQEDVDDFEDEDGCPDLDNDEDGVPDGADQCPNEPETMNDISDEDGCPDLIRVEGTRITTFENVHFRSNSDEMLPRSLPMLVEVAHVLRANPGMRIRVEGHTDSAGDDQHNLELSQARANAVRAFLVENGASGGQIEAQGFGEANPRTSNDTRRGRARNRRVEFHIVE